MYTAHFEYEGKSFVGTASHPLVQGEVVSVQLNDSGQVTFFRVLSTAPYGVNGDFVARVSRVSIGPEGSMTIPIRPEGRPKRE